MNYRTEAFLLFVVAVLVCAILRLALGLSETAFYGCLIATQILSLEIRLMRMEDKA